MELSDPVSVLLIVLAVALLIVLSLFLAFYHRPTKEKSYVRTGVGGEVVLVDKGALVLPILHSSIPVNMNTHRVEIVRGDDLALITKDRLRVNVKTEFYIRVKADAEHISTAARTLGLKTMKTEHLREQVVGVCIDALRSVAASMNMDELHEKRQDFSQTVKGNVARALDEMGLELVSVALTSLDQTPIEFFPKDNALGIDGITYIKKKIAANEKKQNEYEQDKIVAIAQKNHESQREQNAIKKKQTENRLAREKEIRFAELQQKKQIKEQELKVEQEIETLEMAKEIVIIENDLKEAVKRATTQRTIAETWIETDKIKAAAAEAKEKINTAKEKEIAERNRVVELISAEKEAERQRVIAKGTADAERLEAQAAEMRYAIEAAGKRALNEAANLLSNDQISLQIKQQIVNQLPSIIRESVKPIENIEGIKIVHVDGLNGRSGSANGSGGSNNGGNETNGSGGGSSISNSLADQVVDSALRYKTHAPLIESLLKEVDMDGSDIQAITKSLKKDLTTHSHAANQDSPIQDTDTPKAD